MTFRTSFHPPTLPSATRFLAFSLAFGLLGVAQIVIAMTNVYFEDRSAAYLVRLAAFAIIIVAIGRKNRKVL